MALRVTTTGTSVPLDDLGITVVHPTTDRDLADEFTAVELRDSADLSAAIQAGTLEADDGTNFIAGDDYDPDEQLLQELGIRPDVLYTSKAELQATLKSTYIQSGLFPIATNSTASVTKNVYTVGARWITWQLEPGDTIEISGSTAADGTYTVATVTDQQNFITLEAIPNSTGGSIEAWHPPASTVVGIDSTSLSFTSSNTLQGALEDFDSIASDEKVKVSSNDSAADYLFNQLEAGTGVALAEINDGGDEKVRISITPSAGQFDPNQLILDCDGELVYAGDDMDLLICEVPFPGPIEDTNC